MNTFVLYDKAGAVILTQTGYFPEIGGSTVVDVPDGYDVTGVNIETGEAILVPRPASAAERTAALEKQMMAEAATHAGTYEDPVPFIYGMAVEYLKYYSYAGTVYQWADSFCPACVWLPDSQIWQWKVATAPGAYPEWVQPTGAHDAYNKGDIVSHGGKLYQSTIDGNIWAPDAYPAGWTVYEVV